MKKTTPKSVTDDPGKAEKMLAAARQFLWNKVLRPLTSVKDIVKMFNRRAKASKVGTHQRRILNRRRRRRLNGLWKKASYSVRIFLTSRLGLKRHLDGKHIVARQYKKAFKGIVGRHSWRDFDKAKTDAKGHPSFPVARLSRRPGDPIVQPNTPRLTAANNWQPVR